MIPHRGSAELPPRGARDTTVFGAHVPNADPISEATARGADAVQFFLSDPQSWRKPPPRDDAATLRASALPLYVHAPYLVNVARHQLVRLGPVFGIVDDGEDAACEWQHGV